ncbi:MAG: hypothetical protein V7L01_24315 [Nostoc sp.]
MSTFLTKQLVSAGLLLAIGVPAPVIHLWMRTNITSVEFPI